MSAPAWARDLVMTEIRRAFPEEVTKDRLQEELGIGPDDLRATIEELTAEQLIVEGDAGWAMDEAMDDETADFSRKDPAEGETPSDGASAAEAAPGALESMLSPDTAGENAALVRSGGEGPYRARIVLEILSYPEPEAGVPADQQAVVDADEFRTAAIQGVQARWADLQVSGTVLAVDCFDGVRRVFPGGN